jgi:hypothetical protein
VGAGDVDGAGPAEGFDSNVFINCPFDREYHSLLRPLLFTVICLGFTPRIATERSDAGENRLDKIRELIRESKYSLHDLSRLKSKNLHDFKKALSDLSGVDIKPHRNEPDEVIRAVRDWFVETVGLRGVETATVIWYRFGDFTTAFFEQMLALGSPEKDIEEMPVAEYVDHIRDWVREYREAA